MVSNSKFLEYGVSLLAEDERVFALGVMQGDDGQAFVNLVKDTTGVNTLLPPKFGCRRKLMDNTLTYQLSIHPTPLARLKLKVLLCILSLVEGADPMDSLIPRLARVIPFNVLTANLSHIYSLYNKHKTQDGYEDSLFNRTNLELDLTDEN